MTISLRLPSNVQNAKKVMSDSPGLVDFAIRLVNSVLNLPDEASKDFFGEDKCFKFLINSCGPKVAPMK